MQLKSVIALAALPLLAACAPQVEATLRISDIVKVGDGGEMLTTPAILRIPQGGQDDCGEELPGMVRTLAFIMPVVGDGRCVEKDGETYAEIDTRLTLIQRETERPETGVFVVEVAHGASEPDAYALTTLMMASVEEIVRIVHDGGGSYNADGVFDGPPEFLFRIENDMGDMQVSYNQVFVDGAPVMPDQGPLALAAGQTVAIVLSDVASTVVGSGNGYDFATIYRNID